MRYCRSPLLYSAPRKAAHGRTGRSPFPRVAGYRTAHSAKRERTQEQSNFRK